MSTTLLSLPLETQPTLATFTRSDRGKHSGGGEPEVRLLIGITRAEVMPPEVRTALMFLGHPCLISLVRPAKGGWWSSLKLIKEAGENRSSMRREHLWGTGGGRWEVVTGNHRSPDTVCGAGVLVLTHHCLWCHGPHWGKLFKHIHKKRHLALSQQHLKQCYWIVMHALQSQMRVFAQVYVLLSGNCEWSLQVQVMVLITCMTGTMIKTGRW